MTAVRIPAHVPADRIFDVDLFDGVLRIDAHQQLADFRHKYPDIFYTPRNGGHWIVQRQDLINAVVSRSDQFSSRQQQLPPIEPAIELFPLTLDPPDSIPYRLALMRHFGAKHINAMKEDVRALTSSLLDQVDPARPFEFVRALGAGLPVTVFMKLMGLPLEQFDAFRTMVMEYFSLISDARRVELYLEIDGMMKSLIDSRRASPGDDLVSRLLGEQVNGQPFSTEDMNKVANLLFMAGMDTVANAAAHMFYYLSARPELQAAIADDFSLIPSFVEESLRMYGVVNTPRQVRKDGELDGVAMKQGEMVVAMLTLAGRDERIVENPDDFDLARTTHPHMTFGGGPHVCVGQHLARLELRILVEEWFKRFRSFRVEPGFDVRFHPWIVIQLAELRLEITEPAAAGRKAERA
jgi:cytochrome P450